MKKRIISLLMAVVLAATLLPVQVWGATVVDSGYCGGEGDGTNLTWSLDSDGVLTISGEGKMADYRNYSPYYSPWYGKRIYIEQVKILSGVTSIGNCAFYECGKMTDIAMPDGISSLGSHSFYSCYGLTSIAIPDSVTFISGGSFYDCHSLVSITLSNNITSIESGTFQNCSNLTSIVLPEGITHIGSYAFFNCSRLPNITIPDSVTEIEHRVFEKCSNLTSIILPEGVEAICENTFAYCKSLTSITIPSSVTDIGSWAFYDCNSLERLVIPGNVARIDTDNVFYGCTKLQSIEVAPENQHYASVQGALYCKDDGVLIRYPTSSKATHFQIPDGITSIGEWAFEHCSNLTSITIPDGVKEIDDYAFCECDNLTEITLPDGVTDLNRSAFSNCDNLFSIIIPDSVRYIGEHAFEDCNRLAHIYYAGTESQWDAVNKRFSYIPKTTTIHYNSSGPAGEIALSAENFPDDNFRDYLRETFDTDGDGIINSADVTAIDCSGRSIQSLKGIELFTKLEKLNCANNQLTELDTSKNTKLTEVDCSGNSALKQVTLPSQDVLVDTTGNGGTEVGVNGMADTGVTVSGKLNTETLGSGDRVCLTLKRGDATYRSLRTGDDTFSFAGVAPGTYTLLASQEGYVPREYTVEIGEDGTISDLTVQIVRRGDVNGAVSSMGYAVDASDMQCLYEMLTSETYSGNIEDETYRKAVADINSDGAVDVYDLQRLYEAVSGINTF